MAHPIRAAVVAETAELLLGLGMLLSATTIPFASRDLEATEFVDVIELEEVCLFIELLGVEVA
jgi:hypothetical protein